MAEMKVRQRKLKRRRRVAILLSIMFAMIGIDYFAYPYGELLDGKSSNHGLNGLWLRYTWYFGEHPSSEVEELAQRLRREQIRYAYFHVRFIEKTGKLMYHHPEMALVTKALHKADPRLRELAWVYVDGAVELSDPGVRGTMISEARWLIEACGFDGVQWGYEPCPDGDAGFITLLEETRKTLPRAMISVAAPTWFPWPLSGFGWSENYIEQVGKRCDQIAVMCYDTGFVLPRSYAWLVRQQGERVPKWAGCEVLLGLPTYEEGGKSHNPRAENLKIALKAARESTGFAGVALFADYTTDDSEWRWHERAWLH